MMGSYVACEAT